MTDDILFLTGVAVFSLMVVALALTVKEFSSSNMKNKK
jgi:hypothetical protein